MMQISSVTTINISSAHKLDVPEWHPCHAIHGHNYRIVLHVTGDLLPIGWVEEFYELQNAFGPIRDMLDHRFLNDILENPTAERIASWIYFEYSKALSSHWKLAKRSPAPKVTQVEVWETEGSGAIVTATGNDERE